jgi:predicted ATP-dependent serine protease
MYQDEYKKSNREKAMTPTKRKFWCSGCDANHIGQYGKCEVCGFINKERKKKV